MQNVNILFYFIYFIKNFCQFALYLHKGDKYQKKEKYFHIKKGL